MHDARCTHMDACAVSAAHRPEWMRQRVSSTFLYLGGGLGMTSGMTVAMFRSGVAHRLMTASPMMAMGVGLVGTIGTMMATMARRAAGLRGAAPSQ